ncbi:MAG: YidC/Oxa1 family membrane protein insertase [Acidimicrobiales bacterium]
MFASVFDPFFNFLASILSFWYSVIPDYGFAIAMLTLCVMVILTPLTLKGTRSMMMMQAVQPQLKKLQTQYKDDRQKLNEEMLKFYKENNINPLSGCLPLLIQMPVFIVLYRIIRGLARVQHDSPALKAIGKTFGFVPEHLSSGKLYDALLGQTEMKAWGMDLSTSAKDMLSIGGFVKTLPYIVLIVVVAATSFIQQKQISGRNPAVASNPQQQLLMRIGPIMITFISIISPGGLVIYFLVSNLFRVGQQALITRTIYGTPEAKELLERQAKEAAIKKDKEVGAPQKGFLQRMLGDTAPRLDDARGKANGSNGAKAKARGSGKAAPTKGGAPTRPPAARTGGRTTPQGSRSSQNRKKKRK